ncbi:Membrane protein involved in the export of O-antigen and teichoic acid [Alcanivorax sp. DSM 26293]|uniref:flippase n=1 Tax=Alcanivorax sp. DSM 26293 TaxID=1798238 RepID=UPI00089FC880|nr:flippase [Alcanivorax sp. DSM 26293]SEF40171.1 Membrane protein involved in the export of O-antigen and teichoic acid [Alcanivorax sp. DSM 26293]
MKGIVINVGLRQSFIGSFLLRLVSLAAGFAGSVVLARTLGADDYGIYAYIFSIVTILAIPAQVGMPTLIVRETAKARALEQWPIMKGVWYWAARMILAISFILAIGGLAVGLLWRDQMGDEYFYTLIGGLILVPIMAIGQCRDAALRGLRQIIKGQLADSVIRPLLLSILVGGLPLIFAVSISPSSAMMLHVLAAMIAFFVGFTLFYLFKPKELSSAQIDYSQSRHWLKSLLPLGLIGALQIVSAQTDIIMLGILREEKEVGIYKVVVSGAALTLFGIQLVNTVIGPRLAEYYAKSDLVKLQKIVTLGSALTVVITVPAVFVLVFWGDVVLYHVFGSEYSEGYIPLTILVVAQLVNAFFGPVGMLLNMSGHERYSVYWLIAAASANVILNFILIPSSGMTGAAFASLVSICIWNIGFWITAKVKTGIDGSVLSILNGFLVR